MTLARNGRLALWVAVPAVAAMVSIAAPARAVFHQFETSVSAECPPNPPESFSSHGHGPVASSWSFTWGSGGLNDAWLDARGYFSTWSHPFGPGEMGVAAHIGAEPSPAIESCTINATAISSLRYELRPQVASASYPPIPLELRVHWGPGGLPSSNSDFWVHRTTADPGNTNTGSGSFRASLIDLDGNEVTLLGEGTCDDTGCFSPSVGIFEDTLDTSGPGFHERRWGTATGYIGFDVLSDSTLAIRLAWSASAAVTGRLINHSSMTIGFFDALSYDLVSLEPSISVQPMPEPALLSLLAAGAGTVAYLVRRRRR